ncbi:Alpha/Beta hydrolase protein [Lipomyces arxii]|uniref:Alpha/Beta hydrolase protein n=1 Tax=Lipomyces arxii TaxID=56418 RepID=UPI0034CF59B7
MTTTFTHAILGELKGIVKDDGRITQFRGVPFASVPARFRQATPLTTLDGSTRDFSEWGFVCPQIYDPQFIAGTAFGGPIDRLEYTFDEFKCLNLTITVPTFAIKDTSKALPVMVWVHGGGLKIGGGANFGLEDCTKIVEQSMEMGTPVITVALQYRLGPLGFASSKELFEEAKKNGENPGNFGLWDVILGFDWISKFISGFGGNDSDITAFGESAGSIILSYLIISKGHGRKLFKRAIMQSGVATTMAPSEVSAEQANFDKVYAACVKNRPYFPSAQDKVDGLRAANIDDILKVNPFFGPNYRVVVDGVLFEKKYSIDEVTALTFDCDWIESILIGDCQFEGILFRQWVEMIVNKTGSPNSLFYGQLNDMYGSAVAARLPEILDSFSLEKYRDYSPSKIAVMAMSAMMYIKNKVTPITIPEEDIMKMSMMVGSIVFQAQSYHIARYSGKKKHDIKTYLYHFDKINPFPGMGHGFSHHYLDVIYLFKNTVGRIIELEGIKGNQEKVDFEINFSNNFTGKFISFAAGQEPWDSSRVGVIGGTSSDWVVMADEEDEVTNNRPLKGWKSLLA